MRGGTLRAIVVVAALAPRATAQEIDLGATERALADGSLTEIEMAQALDSLASAAEPTVAHARLEWLLATRLGQHRSGEPRRASFERALAAALRAREPMNNAVNDAVNDWELVAFAFDVAAAFESEGRIDRSIEFMSAVNDTFPQRHLARPYLVYPLVGYVQRAGRNEEALDRIDALQREADSVADSDPNRPLWQQVRTALDGLRAVAHLRLGAPDLAAPLVRRALDYEESRRTAADPDRPVNYAFLLAARHAQAELWTATEQFDRAAQALEGWLAEPEPFARHPALVPAFELALGAARMEQGDAELRAQARAILAGVLERPEARVHDRLQARLRLALLAFDEDDAQRADEHVRRARALGIAEMEAIDAAFLAALEARGAAQTATADLPARLAALASSAETLRAQWTALRPRTAGHGHFRYRRQRAVVSELCDLSVRLEGAERGLERLMHMRATGSLARLLEAPAATHANVRAKLVPPDGGVLVLFAAQDRVQMFLVDKSATTYVDRRSDVDLAAAAREYFQWLARRPGSAIDARRSRRLAELGARLTDALTTPEVRERLRGWSSILVIGEDLVGAPVLGSLPVLSERPLGVDRSLTFLSSAAVGLALAARPATEPAAARTLLLVTNAAADAQLADSSPLLSDHRIAALLEPFEPSTTDVLTGPDATLSRLAASSRSRVLHLFVHGVRDLAREVTAGLALTPEAGGDGALWSADVARLRASDLVVLSACGGGTGPERDGDAEVGNLSGAFLLAGARAVVAADADVPILATHRLMVTMHRGLARGLGPAEALRAAREELARDGPFTDPYYHALLRVIGLGDRPLFEPPATPRPQVSERRSADAWPRWWPMAALVAAGALALLGLRRRPLDRRAL